MIPKIIHYCWFGDPYPASIKRCIDSWKTILQDYELRLWDSKSFDVSSSKWVEQAIKAKKYAFAADYIRMYALYYFGGIYLDTDVEVVRSFDDLLELPYFLGKEKTPSGIESATIGSERGWKLAKLMLDRYDSRDFVGQNGFMDMRPIPYILRCCIESNYRYNPIFSKSQFNYNEDVVNVFPEDYFSPKEWSSKRITITSSTYSIHHFAASWMSKDSVKRDGGKRLKERLALFYRKYESKKYRDVALISNNSIAKDYYSYYLQKSCTPLLSTKMYGEDFVRLLAKFESKERIELVFIPHDKTKYPLAKYDFYPIGIVSGTDIEIHFIHSLTKEHAYKEWETGLAGMAGKELIVAYVVLNENDERFYSKVNLPKFKITAKDPGLENLNSDNLDSFFWKRFEIMRLIRKRIKKLRCK